MMNIHNKPLNNELQPKERTNDQHQQTKEKNNLGEDKTKTKNRTRHPFSRKEDKTLLELVRNYGTFDKNCWYIIAHHMKDRSPRQCRERYQLFLSNGIRKKIKWSADEDKLLLSKYEILGPRWKLMESFFNGRNSYSIKNRFTSLNRQKRKLENEDIQLNFDFNEFESFIFDDEFNIFK